MRTFFHFCKVLAGLDQPQTQVTSRELEVMLKYSRAAERVVEIGCFEGATTAAFAATTPGQIYSIDIFEPGRAGVCFGYWIARSQLRKKGLSNVHLIKAFSYEAAKHIAFGIDFLFIDGDHTFPGVERDWADWYPKVKAGGVIAMHDCRIAENSPSELGVMQFYRDRLRNQKGLDEIEGVDSLAVFRKLQ